jgi:hypothetical protein
MIMAKCRCTAQLLSRMYDQKSLMLCWRSFLWLGNVHVVCYFLSPSRLIRLLWVDATMQPGDCWIEMTINRGRSVDAHLQAYLRSLPTVIGCSKIVQKIHSASVGSQYRVSMYYYLDTRSSRNLSFWTTTIHVMYIFNDVGRSRLNAFGHQFTA